MNNRSSIKPIVVIGGGGHASVIVDILKQQKREIAAIISPDDVSGRKVFKDIDILQHDADISLFKQEDVVLINGIGALPGSAVRMKVNEFFKNRGYTFETLVADTAYVSPYAILSEGVQIFHGAIVQPGAVIQSHSVINTRAVIEHDVKLGEYNFVSPGAVVCGQCRTDANVFIGAGATVIQNIKLGAGSAIMANALVTENILPNQKVYAARAVIR
ncbi:NeuD/PglB/VioB family sugar acetyltransferase [Trabulsiella odontotermitis]|uniref:NeuD/PglB/VioB family sugar acetyltransferase n=1 Tax=Trabulsiella odontotermitis TaxID=379893 RepID=UPI0006763BE6|nr:NeuD/PglB/VioB family sugar acetyltransferase [Trabulsiella odontotermitis]KNC91469.1 shikimate dehydrogenase [Trabulsiella odontotermitis]